MAMNAYRNYNTNTSALSKNLEKLSSGYKINRAGDDAAGLAISEKMRAQITGLNKAQDNANDGISLVQTAEGALTEVHDMLNRMYELAVQSANGTYEATDRTKIKDEIDQLTKEIDRIADAADFNGKKLFNGGTTGVNVTLQIGDTGDSFNQLTVTFKGMKVAQMTLSTIATAIASGATSALASIDKAIEYVSGMRGTLGAVQNRLEHTVNNLSVMEENIQNAESRIRDTDVADEMMAYTKNNILIQSAQAMLAQGNAVPQGVLQLLQ